MIVTHIARLEQLGAKKRHIGYRLEIIPVSPHNPAKWKVKMNMNQMLHVVNIYLHFPLDATIFRLM